MFLCNDVLHTECTKFSKIITSIFNTKISFFEKLDLQYNVYIFTADYLYRKCSAHRVTLWKLERWKAGADVNFTPDLPYRNLYSNLNKICDSIAKKSDAIVIGCYVDCVVGKISLFQQFQRKCWFHVVWKVFIENLSLFTSMVLLKLLYDDQIHINFYEEGKGVLQYSSILIPFVKLMLEIVNIFQKSKNNFEIFYN